MSATNCFIGVAVVVLKRTVGRRVVCRSHFAARSVLEQSRFCEVCGGHQSVGSGARRRCETSRINPFMSQIAKAVSTHCMARLSCCRRMSSPAVRSLRLSPQRQTAKCRHRQPISQSLISLRSLVDACASGPHLVLSQSWGVDGTRTRNIQVQNLVPYHWATTSTLSCSEPIHGIHQADSLSPMHRRQ